MLELIASILGATVLAAVPIVAVLDLILGPRMDEESNHAIAYIQQLKRGENPHQEGTRNYLLYDLWWKRQGRHEAREYNDALQQSHEVWLARRPPWWKEQFSITG